MFSMALLCLSQLVLLVGSVSYGPTFPSPLSKEEEKETIGAHDGRGSGGKTQSNYPQPALGRAYLQKYAVNGRDLDDLISIGSIGLIKAVNTFDPEQGRPIGSYAARCIENEILVSLRQEKKTKGEIGIDEVIGTDKDGNQVRLIDVMGISSDCTEQQAETSMDVQRLKAAIERVLGERERVIIELRFGLVAGRCKTQREIADLLGISRSYVSRIEKKSIAFAQRRLRGIIEKQLHTIGSCTTMKSTRRIRTCK